MKLLRDVSASELIKIVNNLGYKVTRQKGSNIRLTCSKPNVKHHITIPNHEPIKTGTLSSISEIYQIS
ncbi:MAG: hypothetical protein HGGPFJEG_01562 [Ignavibacteria bacterium]|nr:hypothetical protein [Ignavibacteria bacterium]